MSPSAFRTSVASSKEEIGVEKFKDKPTNQVWQFARLARHERRVLITPQGCDEGIRCGAF
jgi:hypothetical protein